MAEPRHEVAASGLGPRVQPARIALLFAAALLLVLPCALPQGFMPPKPGLLDEKGLSILTSKPYSPLPKWLNQPGRARPLLDQTLTTIAILVDFYDNPADSLNHPRLAYEQLLFGAHPSGSMRDYYLEVSYSNLTLEGDVVGWLRMPQSYDYYVAGQYGAGTYPRNAQKLVEDAVAAADPVVDFSRYDNDGDGYVDGLFVVHAGPGREETGNNNHIHSHKWDLSSGQNAPGPYLTDDGVYVDPYSTEPEEFENGSLITIGVFCHEFCHVLGAPDLYNTETGLGVVGKFGLMDAGSWNGTPLGNCPAHMSPLFKYLFGWVDPIAVEREGTVEIPFAQIPSVEREAVVYRLLPNPQGCDWNFQGTGQGEYFLVENRQLTGFDRELPGSGLLIWHIDESQPDNNDRYYRLACIMQADGDPSTSTEGDSTDLWSSSVEGFCNSSIPSSSLWDGTPTGASVKDISSSADPMRADLAIGLILLGEIYSYPNPFEKRSSGDKATISYIPTDEERAEGLTPEFKVTIYNLAGERVRVLDGSGEVNAPWRQAFWDGLNDYGEEVASGLYLYIIETAEERNKGRITFIH